jgi:hypothetical protein
MTERHIENGLFKRRVIGKEKQQILEAAAAYRRLRASAEAMDCEDLT